MKHIHHVDIVWNQKNWGDIPWNGIAKEVRRVCEFGFRHCVPIFRAGQGFSSVFELCVSNNLMTWFLVFCHGVSKQNQRRELRRPFVQCPWKEMYAAACQRKHASICAPLTEHAQVSRPHLGLNKTQLRWTLANWNIICTHVFFWFNGTWKWHLFLNVTKGIFQRCPTLCSFAGFEFRRGEQRCEIWRQEILAHRHVFHNRTVPGSSHNPIHFVIFLNEIQNVTVKWTFVFIVCSPPCC